ncbi:MAG: transporter cobalamide binding protein, partial [Bacteroidetes bacterium]|nr:transporter cobalamide binding protein [Bacteroidota bacterium]
ARTFINELLHNAGAANLASETGLTYPTLSREAVIAYDPDVVLVMSDIVPTTNAVTEAYAEWSRLTAVRTGRVYRFDADIVSRPGPRAVEALELLSTLLHRKTP